VRSNFHGPLDREPQLHVYYDSHASWLLVADDGLARCQDPDATPPA